MSGVGRGLGSALSTVAGDAAGVAGGASRGVGGAAAAAGDAASAAGGAARGVGGATEAAGDAASAAGGAARGVGDAGGAAADAGGSAAGRSLNNPIDNTIPPNTPARRAAANDPDNPNVPSREGGKPPGEVVPGGTWKPARYVAGATAVVGVGIAVTITAIMLKNAMKGAANDGKTYNIKLLKNKSSSGTIVTCQFSPSIEPNGVVVSDSITISGTGTALDGNDYPITSKTASRTTCEFDAGSRLSGEVKDKGSFVLHTSFENHMDDEANDLGSGIGGFFSNLFQGLFGGIFGDSADMAGWVAVACCIMSCCLAILFAVSQIS